MITLRLYELTGKYAELHGLIESGDASYDDVNDTLESLDGAIEDKVENIAKLMKSLEAEEKAFKEEASRLTERAKYLNKRREALKEYLAHTLTAAGIDKVKTAIGTASFRKAPASVVIVDEEVFLNRPQHRRFIKVTHSIDKRALLKECKLLGATEGKGFRIIDDKRTLQFR